MLHRYGIGIALALFSLVSACAPTGRIAKGPATIDELPPIPEAEGPLAIDLVYPRAGAQKPNTDSTFLFGSVGAGDAELTINGYPVGVARNGAFLAYVPVPDDGTYTFVARTDGGEDRLAYSYALPPNTPPIIEPFEQPRRTVVVGGRDTLAAGSQIVHAYPAPSTAADRRWFFPTSTELKATGRSGALVRVRLTASTDAWIDSASVRIGEPVREKRGAARNIDVARKGRFVDVRIEANRAPFLVIPDVDGMDIVIYGSADQGAIPPVGGFLEEASWHGGSTDSVALHVELSEPLWGFKAFFAEDGDLIVRLRKPPPIDAANPLRGLRILVDPGHPPGGAIGPTGLTEAEANLDLAFKLADMLREGGAEVVMTRTTGSGLVSDSLVAAELWARVDLAIEEDVDLLISIHNNAFPDGVNPFLSFGTETYYYHPFAEPLAEALQRHLVAVTGLPDLGAKQRSLALVRPSWMPSTLTESLFMMFPQQEAALRNPAFLERLARSHLEGILAFLRQVQP